MIIRILFYVGLSFLFVLGIFFSGCYFDPYSDSLSSEIEVIDGRRSSSDYRSSSRSTGSSSRRRSTDNNDNSNNNESSGSGGSITEPDDDGPLDVISRLSDNFRVEDYLDSVVYIYGILGEDCSSSRDEESLKTCVRSCATGRGELRPCIQICLDNSNSCERIVSGVGTGVFASRDSILTNQHVVNKDGMFPIYFSVENDQSGNMAITSDIEWANESSDVALLRLPESFSGADVPEFGSLSEIRMLDEVFTIGNPRVTSSLEIRFLASLGYITKKNPSTEECRGNAYCIMYSIPVAGGNSGGPVFNADGKLVGLISQGWLAARTTNDSRVSSHLNFGPHIDRIKQLIRNPPRSSSQNTVQTMSFNQEYKKLSRREKNRRAENIKQLVLRNL